MQGILQRGLGHGAGTLPFFSTHTSSSVFLYFYMSVKLEKGTRIPILGPVCLVDREYGSVILHKRPLSQSNPFRW